MPFMKVKRRRAHSVVSGVRVKAREKKTDLALRDYKRPASSLESFHWALRCLMRLTSDAPSSLIGLSIQFSSFEATISYISLSRIDFRDRNVLFQFQFLYANRCSANSGTPYFTPVGKDHLPRSLSAAAPANSTESQRSAPKFRAKLFCKIESPFPLGREGRLPPQTQNLKNEKIPPKEGDPTPLVRGGNRLACQIPTTRQHRVHHLDATCLVTITLMVYLCLALPTLLSIQVVCIPDVGRQFNQNSIPHHRHLECLLKRGHQPFSAEAYKHLTTKQRFRASAPVHPRRALRQTSFAPKEIMAAGNQDRRGRCKSETLANQKILGMGVKQARPGDLKSRFGRESEDYSSTKWRNLLCPP
ncbi:hypothetical protein TNCV_3894801 [Trichonephila clavipes]|nr:hypothetical protein TNCV_3894801 [Trichonephila clavipes]